MSEPAAPQRPIAYAQPQPVYAVLAPQPKGLSVASMVLAIVSVVFGFTFVVPTLSLILGICGMRREPAGRGMAIAGVVISSLILAVWVVIAGAILAFGLFAVTAVSTVPQITN